MEFRGTEEIKALWIAFVKTSNEKEFYALYREFFPYLMAVGLKIIHDRDLVKDVLSQQFMQLWEQRFTLKDVDYPLTYVTTSFKRRLLKQESLYKEQELTEEHLHQLTELSPEQIHMHKEAEEMLQDKITNAIERLSERKKQLIRLKYTEGLSYTEIAERTGLSERTIYNKIHESIKYLREILSFLVLFTYHF